MTFPNGLKIKMTILDVLIFIKVHYKRALPILNSLILFIIMIVALEILSVTKNRLGKIQENTGSITISQDELNLFMKKSLTLGKIGEELPASKPVQWGY